MNVGITSHQTIDRIGERKERRRQFFRAAGGAALALMVATALGGWQVRQDAGGATTGSGVRREVASRRSDGMGDMARRSHIQAHPGAAQPDTGDSLAEWIAVQKRLEDQDRANTTGGVADPAMIQAGSATIAQGSRLYIVASAAEAVFLDGFLPASMGQPYRVVVIEPSKDDAQLLRVLGHLNDERSLQGLPPFDVIDLRPMAADDTRATLGSPSRFVVRSPGCSDGSDSTVPA
jgi:hypothetical protein